jgi:hypothetical protein
VNANLPSSLTRFEADLEQAIRRELTPRRDQRLGRMLRARPRLLVGATIGAAGTSAVLAIVLSAAGSSPAFAVTRNHDGSYSVTLRSLSAIPAANRSLSHMGVHAVLVQAAANCAPPQTVRIPRPHFPVPTSPQTSRMPPPHFPIPVCGPPPSDSSGHSGSRQRA